MKKNLLTFFVMVLAITGLKAAPTNATSWKDQAGTAVTEKNGIFEITTPQELAWVAQTVNKGEVGEVTIFKGKTVKLMNDINLSAYYWQPIGGVGSMNKKLAFDGTFDGNNKCINGLYISLIVPDGGDYNTVKYAGLFGSVAAAGIVKNLGITGGEITDSAIARGAIAGYNMGLIENCYNNIDITSQSYLGGIVGDNEGLIKGCYNTGNITTIVPGNAFGYVGGISGNARNGSEVLACYNTGTIKAKTASTGIFMGGITTKLAAAAVKVTACYNVGAIVRDPAAPAAGFVGGLVADANVGTITACFSNNAAAGVAALGAGTNAGAKDVTIDVLKNAETLAALNAAAGAYPFAADDKELNGGYPILSTNAPVPQNPTPIVSILWENSAAVNKNPAFNTGNHVRGIAAGKVGGKDRLYVVNKGDKSIHIYDNAGVDVGTLDNSIIEDAGVQFKVLDAEVSEDGQIFVGSMAMAAGQKFKLYKWANETAVGEKILEIDYVAKERIGDLFTIVGDYAKGTAKLYLASGSGLSVIHIYEMKDGKFVPTAISPEIGIKVTSPIGVAPKPDGSMYWVAGGKSLKYVDAAGVVSEKEWKGIPVSNSIKYIGYNEKFQKDILVAFSYGGNAELAVIVSLTPGDVTTASIIGKTPILGDYTLNEGNTGDVSVIFDADNNPIIHVLSTMIGFGAYKVTGLDIKKIDTGVENTRAESTISFFPNPATDVVNFSETVAKVSIYSITGQLVKEEINVKNMNINGLNGLYIVKIVDQEGLTAVDRLIIK